MFVFTEVVLALGLVMGLLFVFSNGFGNCDNAGRRDGSQ